MFVFAIERLQAFVSFQSGCVPDSNAPVSATRCELIAIGAKRETVTINVSAKIQDFLATQGVPYLHKFVFGSTREQTPPITTACQPRYHAEMPAQCLQQLAGLGLPNLHRSVKTRGSQPPTGGMKHNRADSMEVRVGLAQEFARSSVPNSQYASPASGRQKSTVWAEGRTDRCVLVLGQPVHLPAIGRVPDSRAAVLSTGC